MATLVPPSLIAVSDQQNISSLSILSNPDRNNEENDNNTNHQQSLNEAFEILRRAIELDNNNNNNNNNNNHDDNYEETIRASIRLYRDASDKLDEVVSQLPQSKQAQRRLVLDKRDEYRERARELSESLLPVAVPIDGGMLSSSSSSVVMMIQNDDDEPVEVDGGIMIRSRATTTRTRTRTTTRTGDNNNNAVMRRDDGPLPPSNDNDIHDEIARLSNQADSEVRRALEMDEGGTYVGGDKEEELVRVYLGAAETYLCAIRLTENVVNDVSNRENCEDLKRRLDMILARVEILRASSSHQNVKQTKKAGTAWWMCGHCVV